MLARALARASSSSPSGPSGLFRRHRLAALAVALAYLVPALACLEDYGPTYDAVRGDLPYGERLLGYLGSLDARWLDLQLSEPVPEVRAPHPDFDVGRYPSVWAFPVGALLSAFSCRMLWTELGLVPAMAAHHLPFVLLTAGLAFVLTAFAARRFGVLGGIVAGGAFFLTPVLFGHSFNNARDIPECCFYTLAVLAGFRALEREGARAWGLAGVFTGLALAQKANALFLPVQLALYLAVLHLHARRRREPGPHLSSRGLALAALGFVLTYYAVSPAFWSQPFAGPRAWLGEMLQNANHAVLAEGGAPARISFAGPMAVVRTTPLVILALALCGAFRPGLSFHLRALLLVSVAVPIGRNLIPGMRHFDGVRHFLEFLPMLALLAGAGAAWLAESARRLVPRADARLASAAVGVLALAPPAWAVVDTHPNQVVYFNALAGGLGGAQRRRDLDAADFWGNSYWQGMAWLNEHAAPGERVLIPYKDFIARSGAPVRLRPDIRILNAGETGAEALPLTVMHLVNIGLEPLQKQLDRELEPLLAIRVQNGEILHVHRLEADEQGRRLMEHWESGHPRRELMSFLGKNRALKRAVLEAVRANLSREETLARLRPVMPAEMMDELEAALEAREGIAEEP